LIIKEQNSTTARKVPQKMRKVLALLIPSLRYRDAGLKAL
jgi:hypothetical protein